MNIPLHVRIREAQPKVHGLAVGMTLAIGSASLSQGCPLIGQCSACAACLPRLPLLAAPLVADALLMLAGRLTERRTRLPEADDGAPSA